MPEEVEATKLRFQPGDIIFGKRRAYQRKLAVADFEGICSAHAMVLRAREDTVVKEFLPVFMQSEVFFERALSISVGSLSPTINWRTLAAQEFVISPKNEQRRIAEMLWAADDYIEQLRQVTASAEAVIQAFTNDFLASGDFPAKPCIELLVEKPKNGFSPSTSSRGLPALIISAIRDGQVRCESNLKYADVTPSEIQPFILRRNDVFVVRGNGNRNLVGRAGIVTTAPENCFYPDLLIRLRFKESLMRQQFACIQWNTDSVHNQLLKRAKSTNGIWKVNGKDVSQHVLRVPPLNAQDRFLSRIADFRKVRDAASAASDSAQSLKGSLMDEMLE